jgi:hypothetical protein
MLLMFNGMELPMISEQDIQDRSKASCAVKVIAYMQITWFVAQIIGCSVQRLLISPLELSTLAIVISTLVSYLLWWYKSLDVDTPMVVQIHGRDPVRESLDRLLDPYNFRDYGDIVILAYLRQTNLQAYSTSHLDHVCFMAVIFFAFAACHILAWNWTFPTPAENGSGDWCR